MKYRENLSLSVWLRTLGSWVETRKALKKFDLDSRKILQGQINYLVVSLVDQGIFSDRFLIERLPAAASILNFEQFTAILAISELLVSKGVEPSSTLDVLSDVAKTFTPAQFTKTEHIVEALASRRIEPSGVLRALLATAATLEPQQISRMLSITELASRQIEPSNVLLTLARLAVDWEPEEFEKTLDLIESLISRANPGETLYRLTKEDIFSLPPNKAFDILGLACNLARLSIDPYSMVRIACDSITGSQVSGIDIEIIPTLVETILLKLNQKNIPMEKVSLAQLTQAALPLKRKNADFLIAWHPEQGHWESYVYMPEGYSDAAGHDYLGREDVWEVDAQESVEIVEIGEDTKQNG